jgi:hypothetical protein
MLSFTLAHISIVWLRVKEPARDRPYARRGTSASAAATSR